MLVCHCHRVHDRAIREAARCGARTPEAVGQACAAGTGCGGCVPAIDRILSLEHSTPCGVSLPVVRAPERGV